MNMTWPQYFDGQGWGNKLAVKYGIESIPATYLLDGNGNIIGKDLRGDALETAVAKALGKKIKFCLDLDRWLQLRVGGGIIPKSIQVLALV